MATNSTHTTSNKAERIRVINVAAPNPQTDLTQPTYKGIFKTLSYYVILP